MSKGSEQTLPRQDTARRTHVLCDICEVGVVGGAGGGDAKLCPRE